MFDTPTLMSLEFRFGALLETEWQSIPHLPDDVLDEVLPWLCKNGILARSDEAKIIALAEELKLHPSSEPENIKPCKNIIDDFYEIITAHICNSMREAIAAGKAAEITERGAA